MGDGHIFISYRRDDSAGYTRAIFEQLTERFSKSQVFMDVDTIEPGLPFDEVINQAVARCDVVLVMIGARWMEPREGAGPRLNDPKDFVRLEIAAALSRDIRVIPVLLDGTTMPAEDALPEPLRPFARRNAIEVGNSRFDSDVERLIEVVGKVIGDPARSGKRGGYRSRRATMYWLLGGGVAAVALVPVVYWNLPGSIQEDWRFCRKCNALFFDGSAAKGVCATSGEHSAQGFNFFLEHDVAGDGQPDWRFCRKCSSMFFNGYPTKGVCPAGGAHEGEGYNFVLEHDGPGWERYQNAGQVAQDSWRFCEKCQSLFFDGFATKGVCPAGGGHSAQGYDFFLPHRADS
jgi:prepilin-type processing-associated H-X9-DG protein